MDKLKTLFPFSFMEKTNPIALLLIILLHIGASIIVGFVLGILSILPLVNLLTGIVGFIVDLYLFVGIVLSVLDYFKVLK